MLNLHIKTGSMPLVSRAMQITTKCVLLIEWLLFLPFELLPQNSVAQMVYQQQKSLPSRVGGWDIQDQGAPRSAEGEGLPQGRKQLPGKLLMEDGGCSLRVSLIRTPIHIHTNRKPYGAIFFSRNAKSWELAKMWGNWKPCALLEGLWLTICSSPSKVKHRSPQAHIQLYTPKNWSQILKRIFLAVLFKVVSMSTHGCKAKQIAIQLHHGILFIHYSRLTGILWFNPDIRIQFHAMGHSPQDCLHSTCPKLNSL